MCAWRFSAGNNSNNGTTGGAVGGSAALGGVTLGASSPFSTGLSGNILSSTAGALLRQNTSSTVGSSSGLGPFGNVSTTPGSRFALSASAAAETLAAVGQQRSSVHLFGDRVVVADDDENPSEGEEEYRIDNHASGHGHTTPAKMTAPATSARAVPFMKDGFRRAGEVGDGDGGGDRSSSTDARGYSGGSPATSSHAHRSALIAASLSRQLFKAKMPSGVISAPPKAITAKHQYELEDDDFEQLSAADREFVLNTEDLFEDVDEELLSENFVPHEHVVGIIASDVTGGEASPEEIDDNLLDYKDLEAEIDADLGDYIEAHHDEFNTAIADFSEMVLAVSGSDDTLARFKKELIDAAESLESHAVELKVLRQRAVKSLFMAETLGHIHEAVLLEGDVKSLVQSRHYLAAVLKLQSQARLLASDEMTGVRAVQSLRDTHNATVSTLQHLIIDDLLACIFRHERLVEADAQLFQRMLDGGEQGARDAHTTAPRGSYTVHTYWQAVGVNTPVSGDPDSEEEGTGGVRENKLGVGDSTHQEVSADSAGAREPANVEHTLAGIMETLFDDPADDSVLKNYLKFVPLCVRSLMLLGRMEHCHQMFFSRATRSIERFIAHFLSLYDTWRRRTRSGASLSGDEAEAAIRGTYVRATELADDLTSFDEAVATIQARDLRAMLGALFAELEKILRNADYLQKVVLVAHFPFLSPFVVQRIPFSVEATSQEWSMMDFPLRSAVWLHDALSTALDFVDDILLDVRTASVESTSSSRTMPHERGEEGTVEVMAKFLEFFKVDALLAPMRAEAMNASVAATAQGGAKTSGRVDPVVGAATDDMSFSLLLDRCTGFLTLRSICNDIDIACAKTRAKYPSVAEAVLQRLQTLLSDQLRDAVRVKLVAEVCALQQQWDLQVLWSQLNYHMEFVFHVICDAKESADEANDLVTLLPFLRQKNLSSRVQRAANNVRDTEKQIDLTMTLDRLLSTFGSGGLLRMMEETGTVSFSLVGAVKKAQSDIRKANEGQSRQYEAMEGDRARLMSLAEGGQGGGAVGGAEAPLVLLQASMLRRWFVFTSMNALTCYECAARFYSRSCDRVPEFRSLSEEDCVVGFFKRFLRATYIPTLHSFHSQHLQLLFMSIGDTSSGGGAAEEVFTSPSSSTKGDGATPLGGGSQPVVNATSGAWPTVLVDGMQYPILACVHYVGQVLAKLGEVRRILPTSLAEEVEQSTSEALITELVVFLKRQVQWLGRGTLAHRLVNGPFEDAFASIPNRKWAALVDEKNILQAHKYIDQDLYRYYQLNSDERTSGHEYRNTGVSVLEAMRLLETSFTTSPGGESGPGGEAAAVDQHIGRMDPREICIRDDGTTVAFALMCTSAEWLCDAVLHYLWPDRRTPLHYTDCCVPGSLFKDEMSVGDTTSFALVNGDTTAQHKIRISGHLVRLCSIAQVALFHLSVEARFLAFLFLPQLRDVSYDVVAASSAADTFVQAYARRVHNYYAILRQHLHTQKLKYTALTAGRPASELILVELAHLRNKAISQAGLMRLRTDLLVMQTTLQLVLPADGDVREAVSRYFMRPALFLRYIFNRDVVNEIVSSLEYLHFTTQEIEVLIRLVFRQVSGANDDTLAVRHIELFYQKLKVIQSRSYPTANGADGHDGMVGRTPSEPIAGAGQAAGPLSTRVVSVVAAALGSGNDDSHTDHASSDDDDGDGANAWDSRRSGPPKVLTTQSPHSAAAPAAALSVSSSEDEEEDTASAAGIPHHERRRGQELDVQVTAGGRLVTSSPAIASRGVMKTDNNRPMRHIDPTSVQAIPSSPSSSSFATVGPVLAGTPGQHFASANSKGSPALTSSSAVKPGAVVVMDSSEEEYDDDDGEYEYEYEEEEEEEEEEDKPVQSPATAIRRPPHPPPPRAVAPVNEDDATRKSSSGSSTFARK